MPMVSNISSFLMQLKYVTAGPNKVGVMVRGPHGIGKSEIVKQYAASLQEPLTISFGKEDYRGCKNIYEVLDRRASQMTEGDLLGLPKIDGDSTKFLPPDWYMIACKIPVVLFFDELDRATLEVRQGLFQLGCSREMNGFKLHDDTILFCAINGGEHEQAGNYLVNNLDPAEQDRWFIVDLQPTVQEWLDWAENKVVPEIFTFIDGRKNEEENHLEHHGEFQPNKVYPSRRSWFRLSKALENVKEDFGTIKDASEQPWLLPLIYGFVGLEASSEFFEHVKTFKYTVTPEDIFEKGKAELVKDFTIEEFTDLMKRMVQAGIYKDVWDDVQVVNMRNFFKYVPSELKFDIFSKIGYCFDKENADLAYVETCNIMNFISQQYDEETSIKEHLIDLIHKKK